MDHRQFVSGLPAEVLVKLGRKQNLGSLCHLFGHFLIIVVCGYWVWAGWYLWQGVIILEGIALCFLFTIEHETTHKTPFASSFINEWVGRLCGVLIVLPFEWFRYFHLAHHRWTNNRDKDPELLAGNKPETKWQFILYVSGLSYWRDNFQQIVITAVGGKQGSFIPESAQARIKNEARIFVVIYGIVLISFWFTPLLFWVWVLPGLIGQPFLRIYLLAEHGRCAFVSNMFENTRTTYTNRVVRFLAWNMPYHVEHHVLPQIPYYNLPELNHLMENRHQVVSEGYIEFTKDYTKQLG